MCLRDQLSYSCYLLNMKECCKTGDLSPSQKIPKYARIVIYALIVLIVIFALTQQL